MPPPLVATAQLSCTFGAAPSVLSVTPTGPPVMTEGKPAATVMAMAPIANIAPFGMCISLANPTVAAATAAALGVLTPMPCVPVTTGPWTPGAPMVQINGFATLTVGSICNCAWGGVISPIMPGTVQTMVG